MSRLRRENDGLDLVPYCDHCVVVFIRCPRRLSYRHHHKQKTRLSADSSWSVLVRGMAQNPVYTRLYRGVRGWSSLSLLSSRYARGGGCCCARPSSEISECIAARLSGVV